MNWSRFRCLVLLLVLAPLAALPQKKFDEGILEYAISTSMPGEKPVASGSLIIMLKGNMIRKEMKMNNGYQNMMLINNNEKTAFSLHTSGDRRYAIQLDFNDLLKRYKTYESFSIASKEQGEVSIAGIQGRNAMLTYGNGSLMPLVYSNEWQLPLYVFDRMPGVSMLPLSFQVANEDGSALYFKLVKIEAKPVASSLFRIPEGYKIISSEELKDMKR